MHNNTKLSTHHYIDIKIPKEKYGNAEKGDGKCRNKREIPKGLKDKELSIEL